MKVLVTQTQKLSSTKQIQTPPPKQPNPLTKPNIEVSSSLFNTHKPIIKDKINLIEIKENLSPNPIRRNKMEADKIEYDNNYNNQLYDHNYSYKYKRNQYKYNNYYSNNHYFNEGNSESSGNKDSSYPNRKLAHKKRNNNNWHNKQGYNYNNRKNTESEIDKN